MRIVKTALLGGILCLGTTAPAQTCNDTYYLNEATEVLRHGPRNNWQKTVRRIHLDLRDVQDISKNVPGLAQAMDYHFPISFKPNCAETAPAKVTYRKKPVGQTAWSTGEENYVRIQLYDNRTGQFPLTGFNYEWWFGFYPDHRDTLRAFLGRNKGEAYFSNWYGTAYLIDSVRDAGTQIWSGSVRYIALTVGPMDSVRLDQALIGANGWLSKPWNENNHPHLWVHTVKLGFDNRPSSIRPGSGWNEAFSARRQGRMTWIRVGDLAARGAPLELWDMFGRKSAVLHPHGYLYAWDGKTLAGKEAPAGVYFARSAGKVLGRFVHTP